MGSLLSSSEDENEYADVEEQTDASSVADDKHAEVEYESSSSDEEIDLGQYLFGSETSDDDENESDLELSDAENGKTVAVDL